jgi:hypothetical protein
VPGAAAALAYIVALPIWRALKSAHPLGDLRHPGVNLLRCRGFTLVLAGALRASGASRTPGWRARIGVPASAVSSRIARDQRRLRLLAAGVSLLLLADRRTLLSATAGRRVHRERLEQTGQPDLDSALVLGCR